MINSAIEKLENEIKNNSNPFVLAIGNYMIDYLRIHPDAAEKIVTEEKTIDGSVEAMRKEAEKVKVGNYAVLTDEQGFSIVLDYFGIAPNVKRGTIPKSNSSKKTAKVLPINGGKIQKDIFDYLMEDS